jgi:hypothetical protein
MRPVSVLPVPSDPFAGLVSLSDQQVLDEVTTWAGRMAAGEAQLLLYVGELDARNAWSGGGVLSCVHWLSWRCGMGAKVASDRVRIARALRTLPKTFAAFAAGQVSFTQVRAITRVAVPEDEAKYLGIAKAATGQQLERLVRGIRRARSLNVPKKDRPKITTPQLRISHDQDGTMHISIRISAEDGAAVLAALEAGQTDFAALPVVADPAAESSAEEKRRPDALDFHNAKLATAGTGFLHLCRTFLQHRGQVAPAKARRDRARLAVHIDPLSGWARLPDGELLPPGALAATLPAATLRPLQPTDLTIHDTGRTLREASQPLRDLLANLDGHRCRFPSCTRKRKLHAHHVLEWQHGGRTDLDNLVFLCSRHHTLVHDQGFRLTLHPHTRALTVASAAGENITHRPGLPWHPATELDPDQTINAKTLPNTTYDKLHLHYAVEVLLQQAA